jgi:hypothetical protein
MKANNGTGNIAERDDWETPNFIMDAINLHFERDLCATEKNTKCQKYCIDFLKFRKEDLKYEVCWMNPPFSKAYEMFTHFFNVVNFGVAIYRCDNMETKVWQNVILQHADWVFIPKGRITYSYNPNLRDGKGCRFPSALIGIGLKPNIKMRGTFLYLREGNDLNEDLPRGRLYGYR